MIAKINYSAAFWSCVATAWIYSMIYDAGRGRRWILVVDGLVIAICLYRLVVTKVTAE